MHHRPELMHRDVTRMAASRYAVLARKRAIQTFIGYNVIKSYNF